MANPVWMKRNNVSNTKQSNKPKRIFIGTPAYEGKVYVHYAMMLLDLHKILEMNGYEVMIRLPVGGSLLVADRNRLVQMFWESEADYMIFLDNDLAFDPRYILRFLEQMQQNGKDFVGGVYPSRDGRGFNFRPVQEDDGKIVQCPDTALLKMNYIPAGCLVFSREVIAKMREVFPELYYTPKDKRSDSESAYCFFDTQVYEGEFWGEDYVFCRRVREAGFDIWVDPTIVFNHAGVIGSLMDSLTPDKDKSQTVMQPVDADTK